MNPKVNQLYDRVIEYCKVNAFDTPKVALLLELYKTEVLSYEALNESPPSSTPSSPRKKVKHFRRPVADGLLLSRG